MVLSGGVTQSAGVTVPVQTNAIELPGQAGNNYVTYAPEQNNVAYSYQHNPMQFSGLPGLPADTNTAGTILIGRTRYPANSVIASNNTGLVPSPSPIPVTAAQAAKLGMTGPTASGYTGPAPSAAGLQAQAPKMDYGTSESAWGDVRQGLTGGGMMRLGAGGGQLPSQFASPDLEGQAGVPNPYQQRPQAPAFDQVNNPNFAGPDGNPWIAGQPNPMDYMPKPAPIQPGLKGVVQRLQRATPQWQRGQAAAAMFGKDIWEKKQSGYNMLAQQGMAAQSNLLGEQMSQQGANYRTDADHFNTGALATLNHMLAVKQKQTMDYGQAYQAAADAFAMPSEVPGPDGQMVPNMMKVHALQQAAPIMGWTGQDVYNLSRSQDPKAANALKKQSLDIQTEAFALQRSKDILQYEIQKMQADTRAMNAGAAGQEFTNRMHNSIERGLRAGALANAMEDVSKHYIHQQISKAEIDSANAGARKAYFDSQRAQLEAAAVPLNAANKIIEVQQKLLAVAALAGEDTNTGKEAMKLAVELRDNAFGAMGVMSESRPVMRPGPSQGDPMVPQIGPDGQPVMMNRPRQNVSPAAAMMGAQSNARLYPGWFNK